MLLNFDVSDVKICAIFFKLDISNSFALPFDEDERDSEVWFLDHEYLENMYAMFKKVNAKERIVGWYHTGPKLHQNDIRINDLVKVCRINTSLSYFKISIFIIVRILPC